MKQFRVWGEHGLCGRDFVEKIIEAESKDEAHAKFIVWMIQENPSLLGWILPHKVYCTEIKE
jgi:hypothetical protein